MSFTPSPGTGDLYVNPRFVNPAAGDFSLESISELINAGQNGYDMGAVPYTVRPLMPSDLEISILPNELDVDLSWVNPTENTDGSALAGLNGVKVFRNGELIADLTDMTPGVAVLFSDVVPGPGEYRYSVLAYTDEEGLYSFTRKQWIGPPPWAAPTGPDAYGYIALETGDPGGPDFDWVEVAPSGGGSGTLIADLIGADDRSAVISLPFDFQYYGLAYDEITVCTNGWLALGDALPDSDWSNSQIPAGDGPAAMLAPFWEDMNLENGGEIASYYDASEGIFVVEFYRVPQWSPPTALETFQVILYDPDVYPSATGDGQILFQWLTVADPSEATFGIENQAEAAGLELGYNNSYATTFMGVQSGHAVLFLPPDEAFPLEVILTPENPPIVIPAGGGSFNYTIDLTAPSNSEIFDVWIDVLLPGGTQYGPLMSREITLPGGQTMSRYMTQSVPGGAPQGEYTYRTFIGDQALGVIWSYDEFTFTKIGVDESGSDSWACGESSPGDRAIDQNTIASGFVLYPNSPNPFNPTTVLSYGLQVPSFVNLSVYDVTGRKVAELVNGWEDAGIHKVTFNASGLATGVYVYRFTAGEYQASGKMVLMK